MNNLHEMLKSNFTTELKNSIYNNINIAIIALKQLLSTNNDFFNYTKVTSIFGYLQTYAIERQLSLASSVSSSGYTVDNILVNNYGCKVSMLKTSNFVCSIGRTYKENELLSKSKYKIKLAKDNYELASNQLMLDINPANYNIYITESPNYAQITYYYDFKKNELKHLNVIVPDSLYKSPIEIIDILDEQENYRSYTANEQDEIIPKLKEDLIARLQKKLS